MALVVTFPLSGRPNMITALPRRREEWRTMLNNPWVAALAVLMTGLVVLGALGSITYLAYSGKGTEAIGALVLGVLGLVLGRLRKIEYQTTPPQSTVDTSTVDGAQTVARQGIQPSVHIGHRPQGTPEGRP